MDIAFNIFALLLFLFIAGVGGMLLYYGMKIKGGDQPLNDAKGGQTLQGIGGTMLGLGLCMTLMTVLKMRGEGRIIFCP